MKGRTVLAGVEDLLFRSKISATAETLEVQTSFPRSPKKLLQAAHDSPPDLLVLDLNSARFEPLRLIVDLKGDPATRDVPVVGFLSHVQKDLAVAAREAGCDRIMARSAFTKDLPKILAGDAPEGANAERGRENSGILPWERIRSETLMETPYFNLRSDGLRLPDGAVKDPYYVLERPDAAIIFPLTEQGDVVLVRQYRPAIEQVELGLPAGLVDDGEEPLSAARRELLEETGYGGGEWEPLGALASSPSLKDNWAYLFLARDVVPEGSLDLDEHERVEVVLTKPDELKSLIDEGGVVSSSGVAAVLLALNRLQAG